MVDDKYAKISDARLQILNEIFELVGNNKKVLEVGCSVGHLSKIMKENYNCEIVGVEIDPVSIVKANEFTEKIYVGSIEDNNLISTIEKDFDVLLFIDVLEHLVDPENVLIKLKGLLRKNGYLVAFIPNVVLWRNRINFFKGKFDYTETGIFDKGHLRFFTFNSAQNLIINANYSITYCKGCNWSFPLRKMSKAIIMKNIHNILVEKILKRYPNLFAGHVLIKAVPRKKEY